MTLKSRMMSLAVAGAFAWPFAVAAQGGTSSEFSAMDRDGNGFVSLEEWNAYEKQRGKQQPAQGQQAGQGATGQQGAQAAQQSGDGQWVVITLTPVQRQMMDNQRRESMFRALDSNSDGHISASEAGLNTQLLHAFAQLDADANGRIERQEFARVQVQDGTQ